MLFDPTQPPQTLATSSSDGFDIALRRRLIPAGEVHELIVNGMFAMDSTDSSSEIALADVADPAATGVLIGGLGLGFTAARVLARCPQARVEVVELSAALIAWAHQGLTPTLAQLAQHNRVTLTHSDIGHFLRTEHRQWDAILLDVDNGPDFLIHDHNADLYRPELLQVAFDLLTPGGVLCVWSEGVSVTLADHLLKLSPDSWTQIVPAQRDGRHIDYALHCCRR